MLKILMNHVLLFNSWKLGGIRCCERSEMRLSMDLVCNMINHTTFTLSHADLPPAQSRILRAFALICAFYISKTANSKKIVIPTS